MKKVYSTISLLLALTLLLVGCSAGASVSKQGELPNGISEGLLSQQCIEIMKSDHYTVKMLVKMDFKGEEMDVETTMAVAENQYAAVLKSKEGSITTIMKDNKGYVMMDDEKEYTVVPMPIKVEDIQKANVMNRKDLQYLGNGEAKFLGKKRYYEEYRAQVDRVRYYFKKEEFIGMEVISKEKPVKVEVKSLTEEVDMKIFEIPRGYKEVRK